MQDNKSVKILAEKVIREYVDTNPDEFVAFVEAQHEKRNQLKNGFAEFKGATFVHRALAEFPEAMDFELNTKLSKDEYEWFKSKEGQHWLVKAFPVFASPERV